ncbi:acyl-CoA thioesterase FadM [Pacificibacter maritimus]|uniref:Acyl-CoA thioesterase FadM n=1 Tax=Pacificibacter maritimus TaxID=762213 RepID=A0A3N4U442_9RHOB|nr:acyl-CoA thioesterase [Pacificibacter maritimus]RPE63085.1 acyl-CoA thioesterase FadM [Pacificibacter maritimus]
MYPIFRIAFANFRFRDAPKLGLWDTHIDHHYCMPWDIDLWWELNNGRTLTLYDFGRITMAMRNGTAKLRKDAGLGIVVAGASVRYRKRITMFQKLEMQTRTVGFDDKFVYIEQSMWHANGDCANHILVRGAVVKNGKMVPPIDLMRAIDPTAEPAQLPDWVQAWADADKTRPWPPERQ